MAERKALTLLPVSEMTKGWKQRAGKAIKLEAILFKIFIKNKLFLHDWLGRFCLGLGVGCLFSSV